jgi:hypothetical protein
VEKLLTWGLVAAALIAVGPTVSGYMWALGWLPAYGAECSFDKVFGSDIAPDGYRIFLLGRGCDIDAAIRKIVITSQENAGPSDVNVDPARIVAVYHGFERAESGDESLMMDIVQRGLREFAGSGSNKSGCAPNELCGIPDPSSRGVVGDWVRPYLSFARSHFLDAINDGADYITSMLRSGPVFQGVVVLIFLTVVFAIVRLFVALVVGIVKRR